MRVNDKRLGAPCSAEVQCEVRELIRKLGEANTTKLLELSRVTLIRVIAGIGVKHGTLVLVQTNLPKARAAAAAQVVEAAQVAT